MTLLQFGPAKAFKNFENRHHRFFGEFPPCFDNNNTFLPKIDISEDEKNIYLEAEIPGIKKEDINILLENNILTIKGEKRVSDEKKQRTIIRNERTYGSFARSFTLREEINSDTANAEFENGILKIVFEKAVHNSAKEIQIQIK